MRKSITIQRHGANPKRCYVQTHQSQLAIFRAYQRGLYPTLETLYSEGYAPNLRSVCRDRGVRLGAYGNPTAAPIEAYAPILGHGVVTGYTHEWREHHVDRSAWKLHVMASVETTEEAAEAHAMGWRTFRTSDDVDPIDGVEISCPASDEAGSRVQCERCGLCDGAGPSTRADRGEPVESIGTIPYSGVILWEGPSLIDGAPIAVIATGIGSRKSANTKTGGMVQVHILRTDVEPHVAQRTGDDQSVCGRCPMRPLLEAMARKGVTA